MDLSTGAKEMRPSVPVEPKPVPVMIQLCSRFWSSERTVPTFFHVGTMSGAKRCSQVPNLFKNFECKAEDFCHSKSMLLILALFACKRLNVESNIDKEEMIQKSSTRFLQGMKYTVIF